MLTVVKLSSVDLNLLLVLHAVLEEQSVVGAARRLHVTPSAVSNALGRLRELLGDPLFVRRGRGLVATPRARELAPALAGTFHELERAIERPAFDPATSTREFKICLADGDQIALLPRVAALFARRMPRAQLTTVSIDTLISGGGLASPSADLAIGPVPEEPDLQSALLYEDESALLVRRDHPRVRRRLSRELFASERHIDTHLALGRPGLGHRAAEAAFARHGLKRRVAVTVPTFAAAAMVAAQTDLIAAMPRGVAVALARAAPLKIVEGPMPALHFPMYIVWHARTADDAGVTALRALIVDAARRSSAASKRPRSSRARRSSS